MKNIIVLFVFLLSIAPTIDLFGQTPDLLNYQGVVRDNGGNPLPNQAVALKISILESSATGTVVYEETHLPTTNSLGLFTLQIGGGTLLSGNFGAFNWGANSYFVKVEMDPTGGSNYQWMGTSQLVSVPYALFAEEAQTAIDVDDADADPSNELQDLTLAR